MYIQIIVLDLKDTVRIRLVFKMKIFLRYKILIDNKLVLRVT